MNTDKDQAAGHVFAVQALMEAVDDAAKAAEYAAERLSRKMTCRTQPEAKAMLFGFIWSLLNADDAL